MLVANRVDSDDGFLNQELELGVGIVDVRVVDALNKCFSCIGSLQTACSVDLEDADILIPVDSPRCVVIDRYVTGARQGLRVNIELRCSASGAGRQRSTVRCRGLGCFLLDFVLERTCQQFTVSVIVWTA